jgi:uncharacterized protein (TIGR02217 family)
MFIEQRLLDCVAYSTEFGPTWSTRKIGLKSGIVRRNPNRSRPVYVASILYQNLLEEHYADVIAAFNACMGGVYSFRMKDWADFRATDELLPVLGTGAPQEIQLVKSYTFGSATLARPIRKPVTGTVSLTANGSPVASTVDYTTGIVTVTATNGHVLRWSGQFDVPMMFRDDQLPFQVVSRNDGGLIMTGDIGLEEDLAAGVEEGS